MILSSIFGAMEELVGNMNIIVGRCTTHALYICPLVQITLFILFGWTVGERLHYELTHEFLSDIIGCRTTIPRNVSYISLSDIHYQTSTLLMAQTGDTERFRNHEAVFVDSTSFHSDIYKGDSHLLNPRILHRCCSSQRTMEFSVNLYDGKIKQPQDNVSEVLKRTKLRPRLGLIVAQNRPM